MKISLIYQTHNDTCFARLNFLGRISKDMPVFGLFTLDVNFFITIFGKFTYVMHWSIPLRATDYIRCESFYGRTSVYKISKSRLLPLIIRYKPDRTAFRK